MKFMCALVLQKGRFFANKQDDTWPGPNTPAFSFPFHPYVIVNEPWGYCPSVMFTPCLRSMSA